MENICFYIENENLYLDQVLVDYNGTPIFFICKNKKRYYIALCTDLDECEYIVGYTSLANLYAMLHGKVTMRDAIINQREIWTVTAGDDPKHDKVSRCPVRELDFSSLPEKNARYEILTDEIKNYVNNFDKSFFDENSFIGCIEADDMAENQILDIHENVEVELESTRSDILIRIENFIELGNIKIPNRSTKNLNVIGSYINGENNNRMFIYDSISMDVDWRLNHFLSASA